MSFNTQPPEGGWSIHCQFSAAEKSFNTQPPEGGWPSSATSSLPALVSTHSRLKAAGAGLGLCASRTNRFNTQPPEGGRLRQTVKPRNRIGFNTQPPEGGWDTRSTPSKGMDSFNTQPPEGGWRRPWSRALTVSLVSTHSRLKAAGLVLYKNEFM